MSAPPIIHGFPPLIGENPRLLILGSMPSVASLDAAQYYAHPRNQFWPILGQLTAAGPGLGYPERCRRLTESGMALWDVLQSCRRRGSLDSDIQADDRQCNDIAGLLRAHPTLIHIYCNGGAAAALFRKHILPGLPAGYPHTQLPSTSPANARLNAAEKLEIWRAHLQPWL